MVLSAIGILAGIFLILLITNWGFSLALRRYIRSFKSIEYNEEDRIVPEFDNELGHYSVRADRDLKVMMLTDIHIGGGFRSYKKDKKTVFELISMLQKEKPDLVILCGDNAFAVPGPKYHGGGTLNNNMVAKDVIEIFEHERVYYTTVFGNHDTEKFDYTDRMHLGRTYQNGKLNYSLFRSEFSDPEAVRSSVTNQILVVKNADGSIGKLILLIDTNDYIDGRFSSSFNQRYDTIHESQIKWAQKEILALSEKAGLKNGAALKTLCFFHIPIGEYETAYRELASHGFEDTDSCSYVDGIWDERINAEIGGRIWFGGCYRKDTEPEHMDGFFETLGPDGINTLEACFCGHDHVNSAVVRYKGVLLGYGLSLDNNAYKDIWHYGLQRGCTVFTLKDGGDWSYMQKNAYLDYKIPADAFCVIGGAGSKDVQILYEKNSYGGQSGWKTAETKCGKAKRGRRALTGRIYDVIKVLFICHGNICRSPMAEFVMKDMVCRRDLEGRYEIASAATSREEIDNPVYPPARRKLAENGISCAGHHARQMTREDYQHYDLIVCMNRSNIRNAYRITEGDPEGKISLLLDYTDRAGEEVADPWYTGDFSATWQDVTEGCAGLIDKTIQQGCRR